PQAARPAGAPDLRQLQAPLDPVRGRAGLRQRPARRSAGPAARPQGLRGAHRAADAALPAPQVTSVKDRIILFDIDGTLIRSGGIGRRALETAIEELHGWPSALDGLVLDGMTDPLIVA